MHSRLLPCDRPAWHTLVRQLSGIQGLFFYPVFPACASIHPLRSNCLRMFATRPEVKPTHSANSPAHTAVPLDVQASITAVLLLWLQCNPQSQLNGRAFSTCIPTSPFANFSYSTPLHLSTLLDNVRRLVVLITRFLVCLMCPNLVRFLCPASSVILALVAQMLYRLRRLQIRAVCAGRVHHLLQQFRILQHRTRAQMVVIERLTSS